MVEGNIRASARRFLVWVLLASAAWTVEAAFYGAQVHFLAVSGGQPTNFAAGLLQSWVSALLWVPATVLAWWLASRWPVTAGARHWVVHLGGLVAVVVGRAAAVVLLNDAVGWYPAGLPPWLELLVTSLLNNTLTYVLLTGLAHAIFYHQAVQATEARFDQARLHALTSQLQPHFLFNALNTIAALIPSRPDTAERMIVDLASLLRFSVDRDSAALVPLAEEIEIGRAYLKIEEHRFEDRLQVVVEVAPDVRGVVVPPFLLQPLLENAVRHGLAGQHRQSTLAIRARRVEDEVQISVADDGVGLSGVDADRGSGLPPGRRGGVGLVNVRERLYGAFGDDARLEVVDRDPVGVLAVVVVPFRAKRERATL